MSVFLPHYVEICQSGKGKSSSGMIVDPVNRLWFRIIQFNL